MKYFIGITLLLAAAAGYVLTSIVYLGGCASLKNEPAAETGDFYEGAAMGYRGMIHVRVCMDKGTITDITVIESEEDRAVGEAAIDELIDLVLIYNTTEIDAVSGATESSKGFLEAIENAILGP